MAKRRTSRSSGDTLYPEPVTLKFDQRLVLLQWMLWLFDKTDIQQMADPLKSADLEGLNEDNTHKYLPAIKALWEFKQFPGDALLGYDQNIVKHTLRLNE